MLGEELFSGRFVKANNHSPKPGSKKKSHHFHVDRMITEEDSSLSFVLPEESYERRRKEYLA